MSAKPARLVGTREGADLVSALDGWMTGGNDSEQLGVGALGKGRRGLGTFVGFGRGLYADARRHGDVVAVEKVSAMDLVCGENEGRLRRLNGNANS